MKLLTLALFGGCGHGEPTVVHPPYPDYEYELEVPGWLTVSGTSPDRQNARWHVPADGNCEAADRFQIALESQGQDVGTVTLLTSADTEVHPHELVIYLGSDHVFRGGTVAATLRTDEARIEVLPADVCTLSGDCEPYDEAIRLVVVGPAIAWDEPGKVSGSYTDRSTRAPLCDITW